MTKKINVKDKLLDDTLDLSCCDLKEVPAKEISVLRRATIVDLSNNDLTILPNNFIILTQIIKLDLSKNYLTELPENFGELVQLKHLDLYSNQISRLPLSLANLKHLKWLDLKENPLTPAVASVAGPCTNNTDCQNCARNIVNYLAKIKEHMDDALRQKHELDKEENAAPVSKKETQKKKKKKADKEKVNSVSNSNKQQSTEKANAKSNKIKNKNPKVKQGAHIHSLCTALSWALLILFLTIMIIPFLPNAIEILTYVKEKTGLPIRPYKIDVKIPPAIAEKVQLFINYSRSFTNDVYQKYFEQKSVNVDKEL